MAALVAHAFYTKFQLVVRPYSEFVLVLKMHMINLMQYPGSIFASR